MWTSFADGFSGHDNFCLLGGFFLESSFVDLLPSEPLLSAVIYIIQKELIKDSTESWTRVFGFKLQGANHYTIEPTPI